jgi:hypothetical protein
VWQAKAPYQSGTVLVMGHPLQVRNGVVDVADQHQLNWLVENKGFIPLQSAKWRLSKKVVLKRGRGLGDLLLSGPVARAMHAAVPGIHVCMAVDEIFVELMRAQPGVDRVVTQPQLRCSKNDVWVKGRDGTEEKYDSWVNLDNIAEISPKVPILHRIDIFAEVLGFKPGEVRKKLEYVVLPEEREWATTRWREMGLSEKDKVVAMALRGTCFNRLLPGAGDHNAGPVNREIAAMAARDGWKVILFDHNGELGFAGDGVVNLAGRTKIREMAALMQRCSMYFGPDTGAWHMACALGIPNYVYFGAINWRLRVTEGPTRVAFKNVPCYPCDRYDCFAKDRVGCAKMKAVDLWPKAARFYEEWKGGKTQPIFGRMDPNYNPNASQLVPVVEQSIDGTGVLKNAEQKAAQYAS